MVSPIEGFGDIITISCGPILTFPYTLWDFLFIAVATDAFCPKTLPISTRGSFVAYYIVKRPSSTSGQSLHGWRETPGPECLRSMAKQRDGSQSGMSGSIRGISHVAVLQNMYPMAASVVRCGLIKSIHSRYIHDSLYRLRCQTFMHIAEPGTRNPSSYICFSKL